MIAILKSINFNYFIAAWALTGSKPAVIAFNRARFLFQTKSLFKNMHLQWQKSKTAHLFNVENLNSGFTAAENFSCLGLNVTREARILKEKELDPETLSKPTD